MRRVAGLLAAAALVLGLAGPARADQKDPKLDGLFAVLKQTTDPVESQNTEALIWSIWMTSDNAEVNRLMQEGVGAMAVDDMATALKTFTKVIEAAPDFAEGWNKRATVLYLMKDFEGSRSDVDRTLALEPRHFGALSGLGLIDTALEKEEDAIDAFRRALAINPNMPGALHNIEELERRIKDRSI